MASLFPFSPFLLEKLRFVLDSHSRRFGSEADCENSYHRLKSALESLCDVITYAEEKRVRFNVLALEISEDLKEWKFLVQKVEYALDEAMDFVDEILYKETTPIAEPRNLKDGEGMDLSGFIKQLAEQMEDIANSFRQLPMEKDTTLFGLRKLEAHRELQISDSLPLPASLLHDDDETAIYGRSKDMVEIVRLLLSEAENLDVIALVGQGGVGKTTLSQLVYNNKKVNAHFELKAWIGVSNDFNFDRITREILEAISPTAVDCSSTSTSKAKRHEIEAQLNASLDGKKLLLVLDDIQRKDVNELSPPALKGFIRSVARASKILITTRTEEVANVMACSTCYNLQELDKDDCRSVFAKSALCFSGRDGSEEETMFHQVGEEFVEHCRGIPLYAKAIGGLLRFKKTHEEWRHIIEELKELVGTCDGCRIPPILLLSYFYLPAQLKGCFVYCSLFPRGYVFDKDELVLLWMQAEGFLQKSSGPSMEEVCAEYFDGLLKRSFFIPVDHSQYFKFKMPELVHELAEFVSTSYRTQHDVDVKFRDILSEETKRLRTFYLIKSPFTLDLGSDQVTSEKLSCIFESQQKLRVLSIPHFQHAELPASMKFLKFLRHLNLYHSSLVSLPESLCSLYLLQTLLLTNCSALRMLPSGIVDLVNLRKLHMKGVCLKQMPEQMDKLASLRSLSNFIVGKGGSNIKELGSLQDLHGALSVSELQNVCSASDASEANLEAMQYLDELELEWSRENDALATDQKEVLENLKPSTKLKWLSIRFYGGNEFPNWLGDSSLSITSLQLSDCSNCKSLPPLGQLSSLQHLSIERMSGIKSIGPEFFGPYESDFKSFQSLKTLKFGEMSQWEVWVLPEVEGEVFPCLDELSVIGCPVLKGSLPKSLPTLTKMEITKCDEKLAPPHTSVLCVQKLDKPYKMHNRSNDNQQIAPMEIGQSGKGLDSWKELESELSQVPISRRSQSPNYRRQGISKTFKVGVSSFPRKRSSPKRKNVNQPVPPQFSPSVVWPNATLISTTPQSSPSMVHEGQDGDQTAYSSSEDGMQSSLSFSSIGMEGLKHLSTDLYSLRIERYASNELPSKISRISSLHHLYIIDSITFEIFPLFPSLKTLYIQNCKSLKFPQHKEVMNQNARLEDLFLGSSCDSLTNFPLNYFPKLKALSLWDCRNLQLLSIEKGLQSEFTSLESLEIKNCPNLRSFVEDEFHAPNLTSLFFFKCGSLKSLQGLQSLKSLQSLYINHCPALESLSMEGLSSLITLCISFCDKITPQKEWKLHELHSLSHFEIEGGCHDMKSFPEEGILLPKNLNSLRISSLPNLTSLEGEGLRKLTSLQKLEINCCEKLDSLPEDGLPSSLSSLSITRCSQLNQKFQNREDQEWSKIAHILFIHLDEVTD